MLTLREYLIEKVSDFDIIVEMGIKRKKYYNIIYNSLQQLLENLALVMYCITDDECPMTIKQNENHWKNELYAQVSNLSSPSIDSNKAKVLREIYNDYDLFSYDKIMSYVSYKLNKEHIKLGDYEYEVIKKIIYFLKYDLVDLVNYNNYDVKHYIYSIGKDYAKDDWKDVTVED